MANKNPFKFEVGQTAYMVSHHKAIQVVLIGLHVTYEGGHQRITYTTDHERMGRSMVEQNELFGSLAELRTWAKNNYKSQLDAVREALKAEYNVLSASIEDMIQKVAEGDKTN